MRYFLLDRVTELVKGERARGLKNVTLTDEVLHDHFPDYPVLPGVLVIEAAAQLAGFLLEMSENKPGEAPRRAVLAQIQKAKFYKPAEPGDQIVLTATMDNALQAAAQINVEATIREERSMRASLTFMLKSIDSPRVHEQRRSLYRLWTRSLRSGDEILLIVLTRRRACRALPARPRPTRCPGSRRGRAWSWACRTIWPSSPRAGRSPPRASLRRSASAGLYARRRLHPFQEQDIRPVLAASLPDGAFSMARFSTGSGYQKAIRS
ncbi:MAG: 3-hydroxyacyl-ACP dehydratase FabZ family protein [Byssovorax sp.]